MVSKDPPISLEKIALFKSYCQNLPRTDKTSGPATRGEVLEVLSVVSGGLVFEFIPSQVKNRFWQYVKARFLTFFTNSFILL